MPHVDSPDPVEVLTTGRLLPVVTVERAASATQLAAALLAGGLRCVEVTLRTDAAVEVIAAMAEAEPALVIGAGTVLSPGQADQAVAAGAAFVVSPGLGLAVVRHCRELGVPVLPGVATATEIQQALDAGVETVKFFPAAELGGPRMLRALSAPFRTVRFVPTGGITAADLPDYLAVPSVLAVGGAWLAPPDLIAAGDWAEITRRAASASNLLNRPVSGPGH